MTSDTPSRPTRKSPKYDLRLPDDMRARVTEAANRNGRSMNEELIAYVEAGLSGLTARETALAIRNIEAVVMDIKKRLDEK